MTRGSLRATVSDVALVTARAFGAWRPRKSVVALGAAGAFGAALASVPLGTRRARRACRRCYGGGRAASHQLGNLLLQGLDACVDAIELDAHRIAELRIRAAVKKNRRHRGFCRSGRDGGTDFTALLSFAFLEVCPQSK